MSLCYGLVGDYRYAQFARSGSAWYCAISFLLEVSSETDLFRREGLVLAFGRD